LKALLRIILYILDLAVVGITISQISILAPVSIAKAHSSSAFILMSDVSPTPTPTVTDQITQNIQNVTNPAQAIVNLVATIFVFILVIIIAVRIIKIVFTRPSNLVVETFKNSTGNSDLDKVLPGLTQSLRERLVKEINDYKEQTHNYKQLSPNPNQPLSKGPVPSENVDQQLTNLLKSLQDAATGQIKTAVQLLSLVFPPRGTKVIAVLHLFGETIGQPCISLEVTDLQDQLEPMLYTIRKASSVPALPSNNQSTATPVVNSSSQQTVGHTERGPNELLAKWLQTILKRDELPKQYQPNKSMTEEDKSEENKLDLRALETQYIELHRPVARWLAIELAWRSWAAGERWTLSKKKHTSYQAKLWNFIGLFHLATASDQSFSNYPFFFGLAIQDFQRVIDLIENSYKSKNGKQSKGWYLPYENLGDTYILWGLNEQDNFEKEKNSISSKQQALDYYNQALDYYNQALQYLDKKTIRHLPKVTGAEQKEIERRIQVEIGTTQMYIGKLTSDKKHIELAKKIFVSVEDGWDATIELDSQTLYNLASFHALQSESSLAHRYLAYSLVRDINRYYAARQDPDLISIKDGLETLITRLNQKLHDDPDLKFKKGKPFEDAINKVLSEANWLS